MFYANKLQIRSQLYVTCDFTLLIWHREWYSAAENPVLVISKDFHWEILEICSRTCHDHRKLAG